MPKVKNQKDLKKAIFRRDKYKCLMCGKVYDSLDLTIYFDTPKGYATSNPDNILTLCLKCKQVVDRGSILGKTGKDRNGMSRFIIDRWNKEDILNMKLCRKQTETVYPIGKSPNKSWYKYVYGGQEKPEVNSNYKERTPNEIIKSVVNFSKDKLKEAMIKVLEEKGQDPEDWGIKKELVTV